ncbi:MAG: transferrin-binding protein-like solute binding protein [Alphaproteobacteria bacterium]|nr:transferrin-binding protein-like solute binding protein [Alphaproteobacteria bacterium]MDE2041485.1 transferrin-binding protein-like solute binding protein [Alphaproteobacteria bacterium]MDE2340430.1 transferrin-binding protein-like solute binding protein [Alphaproteobacteria bacterium]
MFTTASLSLSGSSTAAFTVTPNTALFGMSASRTQTADTSAAGLTGTVTFTTPGGTVVAQYGGSNNYNTNSTKDGQTTTNGDLTITSSTDPALTNAGGGSFKDFSQAAGLSYTNFGQWNLSPCANTASCLPTYVGVYAGGAPGQSPTPIASMPTTGTATYSGGAYGLVTLASTSTNGVASVSDFYGTSNLTANFATGGITGSITGINAYSVGGGSGQTLYGTLNTIGLTAKISGSSFAGTTSVTGGAGTATAFDLTGATGKISGAFYGPTAQEAAAVFSLSGGNNGVQLVGALGAKLAPVVSDRRLKTDIAPAGTLPNGLKLYRWRYRGEKHHFVGVMAQDLLADQRFAGAVIVDADGLMRVDYDAVGYHPADFARMSAEGEQAVARYRRTKR